MDSKNGFPRLDDQWDQGSDEQIVKQNNNTGYQSTRQEMPQSQAEVRQDDTADIKMNIRADEANKEPLEPSQMNMESVAQPEPVDASNKHNFLWGLLGFLAPTIGLTLTFVWWRGRHKNAKACLWGFSLNLVVRILLVFVFMSMIEFYAQALLGGSTTGGLR